MGLRADYNLLPIIPTFMWRRQEDYKVEVSLSYIMRPCLKNPKQTNKN